MSSTSLPYLLFFFVLASVALLIALFRSRKKTTPLWIATDMQAILSSTDEGLLARFPGGAVRFANPAALRILGVEEKNLLASPNGVHDLVTHLLESGEACNENNCPLLMAEKTGVAQHSKSGEKIVRPDGRIFPIEYVASPVQDPGGTGTGVVVSFRDVGERIALEERLAHSERLETAGRLAGGVAHDLNNVMTIIRTASDLIMEKVGNGSPAWWEAFEISKAVDSASSLTRQLLTFSRHQLIQPLPTDLHHLLHDSYEFLRRAAGDKATLSIHSPQSISPIIVDPTQIRQVIINLVLNAAEAIEKEGEISLTLSERNYSKEELEERSILQAPEAGLFVSLEVKDTGSGIDKSYLTKVFDPFFTTKADGSGLGLATAYGTLQSAGGTIFLETGDMGTAFQVLLPVPSEDLLLEPLKKKPLQEGKERILFVEDNKGVSLLVKSLLEGLGYSVEVYASPIKALEKGDLNSFDLLLSDVVMPKMNGIELCQAARKKNPFIKVLLISGYTKDAHVEEVVSEEGIGFLEKPFSKEQISSALRTLLDN